MTKIVLFFALLFVFIQCDTEKKHLNNNVVFQGNNVDFDSFKPSFHYSSISTRIDYISLEEGDQSLLGEIDKVVYKNNKFYVLSRNNIIIYGEGGKYLGKLDCVDSKGPGCFINIKDFDVNKSMIIVYDNMISKISLFNEDNLELISEQVLSNFYTNIACSNRSICLSAGTPYSLMNDKIIFSLLDFDGKLVSEIEANRYISHLDESAGYKMGISNLNFSKETDEFIFFETGRKEVLSFNQMNKNVSTKYSIEGMDNEYYINMQSSGAIKTDEFYFKAFNDIGDYACINKCVLNNMFLNIQWNKNSGEYFLFNYSGKQEIQMIDNELVARIDSVGILGLEYNDFSTDKKNAIIGTVRKNNEAIEKSENSILTREAKNSLWVVRDLIEKNDNPVLTIIYLD